MLLREPEVSLVADTKRATSELRRCAQPELAEPLYELFCAALEEEGIAVARGARMDVSLVNDGPVTIVLDA